MKVLLYSDGQGWIVDRISKKMREICGKYGVDIDIASYKDPIPAQFPQGYDLIHFNNWDIYPYQRLITGSKVPVLVSIRSFRFPDWIPPFLRDNGINTHVINPKQLSIFTDATCISDGLFFENLKVKEGFTVGMAFQNNSEESRIYKGYYLVKEACDKLGIKLEVAGGELGVTDMQKFYDSVDLMVVASQDEGANTIAMECAAINKPLLTTGVGVAKYLTLHTCERNVESITTEIKRFYTAPQVAHFTWEGFCKGITDLYKEIVYAKS